MSPRAYFSASIAEFQNVATEAVLGRIVENSEGSVEPEQRDAWVQQIRILKSSIGIRDGTLFLEFSIPRMGRRVDAVLVAGGVVIVIEFKAGAQRFTSADEEQVLDYALDLKNFHRSSHDAPILPILVATHSTAASQHLSEPYPDGVYRTLRSNADELSKLLKLAVSGIPGSKLNGHDWGQSPYHPTPTIIEAAQSLYSRHSVEAIARHDAGAKNLNVTSKRLEDIVDRARTDQRKIICFVTGVPGAGKTLVGLNIATKRSDPKQPTHAVYLSGNGPLVAVMREALTRDEHSRRKEQGQKVRKRQIGEGVKAFIQNVHHFRDEFLRDTGPPIDHVVIFDEAQRAWDRVQTHRFMKARKKRPDIDESEPELLIEYLDRHPDWAVIICLVGGGQEIHTGEAGIGAWLDAINERYPHWDICISPELTDSEYVAGQALQSLRCRPNVEFDRALHLSVSMRSFRAENVSQFVKAVLDRDLNSARQSFASLKQRYPIVLTRDLNQAKCWTRERARGSERFGLLASSRAQRLKPHAIDVRVKIDPVQWFLNGRDDARSSYYMEDAATEFQVQGLELDWACVTWDGDLRYRGGQWGYHDFRGSRWCNVHDIEKQAYLRNTYRVLLTRARQGMAIFVPLGSDSDPTRSRSIYDSTYEFLSQTGIPVLGS